MQVHLNFIVYTMSYNIPKHLTGLSDVKSPKISLEVIKPMPLKKVRGT